MHDRWGAFTDLDPSATDGAGPLAGLSIGIKANIAVNGLPWTAGLGTRRGVIAAHDAAVVALLRAAGATIPGTLNMHEAALGATTDNLFYGRTHNPHRHGFTPGGSSGGSGAAVAAGLVNAALGTDTLGSIRIPAAYCGVYGLKPTLGAVPTEGLLHLGRDFDVIGPLARSLDMLERVWDAIKPDRAAKTDVCRVMTLKNLADIVVQPAVRAAYDRAVATFADVGPLTLDDAPTAIRMAALVQLLPELLAELGDARNGPDVSPELRLVMNAIEKAAPAPDILARTKARLINALGDDGILIMPTAPQAAFAHGTRAPANQADFCCLASVAGLPAITIPAGFDGDNLPVGIQIVGPPHSEAVLFKIVRRLDAELAGYAPPADL